MIELITVMMIVAILSVMAGMGLVQIANGYVFAKKNAVAAQQAQIALTRLAKEFSAIQAISAASANSITYTRAGAPHTLAWTVADQSITLDGDTLIDKVQSFSLTYQNTYNAAASSYSSATAVIELTFQLKGYNDIPLTFVERVAI
jgi:type II secretory pathway pseudopilin PulG